MSWDITVSCELAVLSQPLHGFLQRDRGYYNVLVILSRESDFLSREGEGTNITLKINGKIFMCGIK